MRGGSGSCGGGGGGPQTYHSEETGVKALEGCDPETSRKVRREQKEKTEKKPRMESMMQDETRKEAEAQRTT